MGGGGALALLQAVHLVRSRFEPPKIIPEADDELCLCAAVPPAAVPVYRQLQETLPFHGLHLFGT